MEGLAGWNPEEIELLAKQGENEIQYLRNSVDLFAERYGWTKNDVLALPTEERLYYQELVQARNSRERSAARSAT